MKYIDIINQANNRLGNYLPKQLTLIDINDKIAWWKEQRSGVVLRRLNGEFNAGQLKAHLKKIKMELMVLRRMRLETLKRMKKKLVQTSKR